MTKIWVKTVTDHKVRESIVYDNEQEIDTDNFRPALMKICEQLKIPTPIVTGSQIANFMEFNILKLKQRDFIETINFDFLEFNAIKQEKEITNDRPYIP